MPPHDHAEDHEDRRHERGEDRILGVLQAMSAAQSQANAQLVGQLSAVQLDIKVLAQADQKSAVELAELKIELRQAKADATEAKTLAGQLKEQVNRWQGWSAAGLLLVTVLVGLLKLLGK